MGGDAVVDSVGVAVVRDATRGGARSGGVRQRVVRSSSSSAPRPRSSFSSSS